MKRRSFLKAAAGTSVVSCISGCSAINEQIDNSAESTQQEAWSACLAVCLSNCPLKVNSKDGVITSIETDNSGTDHYGDHQVRACLRGRSTRQRNYTADRLKYPMKRVPGTKRGDNQWQQISWQQAFTEIAEKTTNIQRQYGPRSILHLATPSASGGSYALANSDCIKKFLSLSGGHLNTYGNYSFAQIFFAAPATFGSMGLSGTSTRCLKDSDLFIGFGFNPFETRMSGGGEQFDFTQQAVNNKELEIYIIDPRYTDSSLGKEDHWLPIRPGTDAAVAEAIAYQMISSNWVNTNSKAFIDQHTIGYDRKSLEAAQQLYPEYRDVINPDENYHDYIMGVGKYSQAKTPEWASKISGMPVATIVELASKIMNAKAPYLSIGASCNRQACGEQNMRALYMLPILTGKIGQAGVNNGELPYHYTVSPSQFSDTLNQESAAISFYTWPDAIVRGESMTPEKDGIRGTDGKPLGTNVKALFMSQSNSIINQHSDINATRKIIEDDSLCELIVVSDCWMTSSCRFADYVLPDSTWLESVDISNDNKVSGDVGYLTFMTSNLNKFYDTKSLYEVGLGLSTQIGKQQEFSEGLTQEQWLQKIFIETKAKYPELQMPETLEQARKVGFYCAVNTKEHIAMSSFVHQGEALKTPSGKIEIFSLSIAKRRQTFVPLSDADYDQITPLPQYTMPWQGAEDTDSAKDYPLQVVGYHTKGRTHSSFHNVSWLREAVEDALWLNPLDAQQYQVESGDLVIASSPQGKAKLKVKVTPRVMPGVVALGQGAWYTASNINDIDEGGNINVLTKYRPTPLAKANPQHTLRINIVKA